MVNSVILSGRLTRDCEHSKTQSGRDLVKFSIAYNEYRNVDGEWQEETDFYDVEYWGESAARKAPKLVKGAFVEVTGSLKTNKWEKDGKTQKRIVIRAQKVDTIKESKSPGTPEPQQGLYDSDIPF